MLELAAFFGFREGKRVAQIATIGRVPRRVAEFLGLDYPEHFTGHCLTRIGATLVAESCGNILLVKETGGRKSSKVEESIKSKM